MPSLVVGPLLRYVDETAATVWVETDAACEVEVLGHRCRTVTVAGHHYAVVAIDGLAPGSVTPYDVRLDGRQVWPHPGSPLPPSVIRTLSPGGPLHAVFGSCRVTAPQTPAYSRNPRRHFDGFGVDTLRLLARRTAAQQPQLRPDVMLLLGDQVYVDLLPGPVAAEVLGDRSPPDAEHAEPGEAGDFEEVTRVYRAAWTEPHVRWLLSTVPSVMILDDHDITNALNASAAWAREMQAEPWWEERLAGTLMAYWLYQHAGNLAPGALATDPVWTMLQAAVDGAAGLRAAVLPTADPLRPPHDSPWNLRRDVGPATILVLETRAGRVLRSGRRELLAARTWTWLAGQLTGGSRAHLLLVSSVPVLLPEAVHHLEAWDESVAAGRWGRHAARAAEALRRLIGLEHWPAFRADFDRLMALLASATNARDLQPASVLLLSGDVHYSYVAPVTGGLPGAPVVQLVASPFRNALTPAMAAVQWLACTRLLAVIGRLLRRTAAVPAPPVRWRLQDGPFFGNSFGELTLTGTTAEVTFIGGDTAQDALAPLVRRRLA